MMNIEKNSRNTTFFTLHVRSFECAFLSSMPTNSMFRLCISTHPSLMICSVRPVFFQPTTKAWLRTEKMLSIFKISCWTFKHFTAKIASFLSSISRASSSGWTFMVTFHGAIFSFIGNKITKGFSTDRTSFFSSPFIFFPAAYLFTIFIFPVHNYNIILTNEIVKDYYKDYYEAALDRFNRHKQQLTLAL
jgi:hypothetical protein